MSWEITELHWIICILEDVIAREQIIKDFSHRNPSLEAWLISRGKVKVSDKWLQGRAWSKFHRLLSSRQNASDLGFTAVENHLKEFWEWVSAVKGNPTLVEKYAVEYTMRPSLEGDGSYILSSFAVDDLTEGDTILDIPVRLLLSERWTAGDPKSLRDAPWEVRLAAKLLRERSRGDQSVWASYIKLLPNFVPLPLFFSDLELKNIQDRSVESEVRSLRKYIKWTYESLRPEEIAEAKFSQYAWALSTVYSSACQLQRSDSKVESGSSHFLLPFFGSSSEDRGQVYADYEGEHMKLISHDVKRGMPLGLEYASSTVRDTLIFRGFVPKLSQRDHIKVFRDVLDLVDWYSSNVGAVNSNRPLTWRIARDMMEVSTAYLQQRGASTVDSWNGNETEFTVGASGFVDPYMMTIFTALSYAKQALGKDMSVEALTTAELILRESTAWERIMQSIAAETVSRYRWDMIDCETSSNSSLQLVFKTAKSVLLQRLTSMLDSASTDIVEDKILLQVADWEGMNELGSDQLACPTCRWQTEQMSLHDSLAIQYRLSSKMILTDTISAISCGANGTPNVKSSRHVTHSAEDYEGSLQKFVDWCAGHDLIISGRLAITDILVPPEDEYSSEGKVRGVVALRDIEQGETLSSLPMTVGLYNNDSVSDNSAPDAWDSAAARLLREKAKGSESDWAPYIAILPDYLPTPVHLDSQELGEVQWWPVMRELIQVRKAIKESYAQFSSSQLALADFNEFKWAVTMVHSRAFTLPVKPDEQYEQYVLMPFMDMINHHYQYKADWMSQPVWDGKLEIVAKRTVKKGEELFASFGPRTNDNLFLYYGFVLRDNPFDAVPIFGSFSEALMWFQRIWGSDCTEPMDSPLEAARCQWRTWHDFWHRMEDSVEEAETGSGPQGKEWGELVNYWADLGFQFLPYQPGPTIYPRGIVDPSILAVFSASFDVLLNGSDPSWPDHCSECGNRSAIGSSAMRKFFACIENQAKPVRGLLDGLVCRSELTGVFLQEERLTRGLLVARISVVLRCKEILSSFPTSIVEDRKLMKSDVDTCIQKNSSTCRTSSHLQLARKYRYMKKLLIQTPVDKLLN
ncbi:hypothetical protein R1sor_005553 [Riccia sorocarpa]|uniref:SET domain-containing protein n=1 Tax=Riccia sorocarpa TaxID=122646 RepID=A0ABD3HNF7_9MARC